MSVMELLDPRSNCFAEESDLLLLGAEIHHDTVEFLDQSCIANSTDDGDMFAFLAFFEDKALSAETLGCDCDPSAEVRTLDWFIAQPGHLQALAFELLGNDDFFALEKIRIGLEASDLIGELGSGKRHCDREQLFRDRGDPFGDTEMLGDVGRVFEMREFSR